MGERSEFMNSDKLKNLIESAREQRKISQRELAKISGISRSTLNDLINGKIKKINLDDLIKISETLNISLESLLEACGFDKAIKTLTTDRYAGMTTKTLKELLDKYQQSEMNLLDWDAKKRTISGKVTKRLFNIRNKIELSERGEKNYPYSEIIADIDLAMEELKAVHEKYDYSKLPRNK